MALKKSKPKSKKAPRKRSAPKAHLNIDQLAFEATKKFVKLAYEFPRTDFLSCEDYPYPGHQDIFEDTYRKIATAIKGRAVVTVFQVLTYRHGYMALECELSDDVSDKLEEKLQAILSAGQRLTGGTCTICGAKVASRAHLKSADPGQAFCKSHSLDERQAAYGSQVEVEKAAAELGFKLVARP